ncbi:MAG: gamma-butyrobetaine hydroxylase-like domain-containing protein [Pseudomonadales bacterium]
MSDAPIPNNIHLHKHSAELELGYSDGASYRLSCEYLRVYSPSAEVRGHGKGQEVLQTGKKYVNIEGIEATGNYAIQISFNDGHDTGIYSWDYLYDLCANQQAKWQDYLARLKAEEGSREPNSDPIIFKS